jgi:heme/copper-type cytochrome/quinol oxidase subunit 3
LGVWFTIFQFLEYNDASFNISDSVYGSCFYLATGFHGLHVFVGTVFLLVCYIRMLLENLKADRHFGFLAAIWYWHFVDVVWLFLYLIVYCWGGNNAPF